ncbi:uncharacterized protein BX664DRAFT_39476 [Halteromyces radiatus]|uniref:uncharacterized protein n=1 Tax=Halteromyces radiatus TaxID=101107 RepID=UPI0022206FB7|nr:uncharacterized protein BX664DRAFT_39476 [Halteromyces radiatus]KAI8078824.1 hypothetical protein BX664DRAFT_39476 [Halteromyces radiatus]
MPTTSTSMNMEQELSKTVKSSEYDQPIASRPFQRNHDTHPLVRMFENNSPQSDHLTPPGQLHHSLSTSPINLTPVTGYASPISASSTINASSSPVPIINYATASLLSTATSGQDQLQTVKQVPVRPTVHSADDSSTCSPSERPQVTPLASSYLRPSPNLEGEVSTTPPGSSKLTPGVNHARSPTQFAVSNKLTPLTRPSSPDNPPSLAQSMSRTRSYSDQRQLQHCYPDQTVVSLTSPNGQHHQDLRSSPPSVASPAVPLVPAHLRRQNSTAATTSSAAAGHLARRVRSATTLRRSEEDSVPLKALVTNKQYQQQLQMQQQQQQQQQKLTKQHLSVSVPSDNNLTGNRKHAEHRRSISADNVSKCKVK